MRLDSPKNMNTLCALVIMVASITPPIGWFVIAIVMLLMGWGGAPGGILYEVGLKNQNGIVMFLGFIMTALGQAFVICAYTILVVSALRAFSESAPNVPTWPLWISAFLHSGIVPAFAMKEKPATPSSQHMTLGIVASISLTCFLIMAFAPQWLSKFFAWVPFFQSNIK